MKIWNPADESLMTEAFPDQTDCYSSPALVAINGGRDVLLYPGRRAHFNCVKEEAVIWKYNLASRAWSKTGLFIEAKTYPMVLPLSGFRINDFNCLNK
jgi:hypothetical protein